MAIAAPIGAYLFSFNRRLPFYLDVFAGLMAFIIYLSMHEARIEKDRHEQLGYGQLLKEGWTHTIRNPYIRWYALFMILISIVLYSFNSTFGQPLLVSQGVLIRQIGYIYTAIAIIQALTSFYAEKIERKLGENVSIIMIFLVIGIAYIVMRVPILFIVVPFYLIYNLVKGFQHPVLDSYVQKHISSQARATVLSIQSFFASLLGALSLPLFGYIADQTSLLNSVTVLGITTLVGGFCLYWFKPKDKLNYRKDVN
jgi:hypothetical protein